MPGLPREEERLPDYREGGAGLCRGAWRTQLIAVGWQPRQDSLPIPRAGSKVTEPAALHSSRRQN